MVFRSADVCVLPAQQGRGPGGRIMARLTGELEERDPEGAHVPLIADGEAHRLHATYGFVGTAPDSAGMHRPV
ncbi:hypothetical protein ABTX81_28465 [Kitasatospora sp. NPDC097605]|uniref:hypothetical protein n=1 Tax=Kitasatospora sp. NPDC097605 TaxID=3157226 RepID=UPI00331A44D6